MIEKNIELVLKNYPEAENAIEMLTGYNLDEIKQLYQKNSEVLWGASLLIDEVDKEIEKYLEKDEEISIERVEIAVLSVIKKNIFEMFNQNRSMIQDVNKISQSILEQCPNKILIHIEKEVLLDEMIKTSNESAGKTINFWRAFKSNYPVAVGAMYRAIEHLINSLSWILDCVNRDKKILKRLNNEIDINIVNIKMDLGDLHVLGKGVSTIVTSEKNIILKPRNANIEIKISEIINIINSKKQVIDIGIPEVINRDSYSWHEYITFEDCKTEDDFYGYYHNIGGLIALMYGLNGVDFHYENIVAKGSCPYLIDLECLFSGKLNNNNNNNNFLDYSVLNSYITPPLVGNKLDKYICGIGLREQDEKFISISQVKKNDHGDLINNKILTEIPNFYNRPISLNKISNNQKIKNIIIEGFTLVFDVLKMDGVSNDIVDLLMSENLCSSRFLHRTSQAYADILSLASHPRFSMNLFDRKVIIASALYDKKKDLAILKQEYLELLEGRIPYFYSIVDNKKVEDLKKQLDSLKEPDSYNFQNKILKMSLERIFPNNEKAFFYEKKIDICDELDVIINSILFNSINYKGNYVILNSENFQDTAKYLKVMDTSLYSGKSSFLFLKICCYIVNKKNKDLKNDIIQLFHQIYEEEMSYEIIKYGVFEGRGSILYLTYLMSKYVDNFYYTKVYFEVLSTLILKLENDKEYLVDIIGGISGLLIVCCRMYRINPTPHLLNSIEFITNKIIDAIDDLEEKGITWEKQYTGFAHGNSGILYSLILANEILDNDSIQGVVLSGLIYEKYNQNSEGWNDLRFKKSKNDFNSWCHGALGIYMSRKAMLRESSKLNPEIVDMLNRDINYYYATQQRRKENKHSSLCHGVYAEALLNKEKSLLINLIKHSQFDKDDIAEDKSIMTGKLGLYYAYFKCENQCLPNLLLLE